MAKYNPTIDAARPPLSRPRTLKDAVNFLPVCFSLTFFSLFGEYRRSSRYDKLDSLPFRFKAGGDSKMPAAVSHSHRPTTKVSHKPFKSKSATKHELRDRSKGTPFFLIQSSF